MSDHLHTSNKLGESQLRRVWDTLLRDRWLVLAVFLAVVTLTAVLTWMQRPVYQTVATIRIENESPSSLLNQVSLLAPTPGQGSIATEMLVIRSRQIVESVVDSLSLHVAVKKPWINRDDLLSGVQASRNIEPVEYEFSYDEARQGYVVTPSGAALPSGTSAFAKPGVPFQAPDLVLVLNPELTREPVRQFTIAVSAFRSVVDELRDNLSVDQPRIDAQIVDLWYRHTDPPMTSAVVNAVTETFLQYNLRGSRTENQGRIAFLRDQVGRYQRELATAEAGLRRFREQEQVVSLPDQATEHVQRLADLQAERDLLGTDRQSLQTLLSSLQTEDGASQYRRLASFPAFLSNRAFQDVLQALVELENRRAELSIGRTSQYIEVQGVNQRIKELESQLYDMAGSYLASLNAQYASVSETLGQFEAELSQIPAKEIAFARLSREQGLLEEIYSLLQTRLKEAELDDAVSPDEIRVIDPALVPQEPISPRPFVNLSIATVLGLVLGVAAAFGRQSLDTRIRTREHVEAVISGVPILAMIPRIRMPSTRSQTALASSNGNHGRKNGTDGAALVPAQAIDNRLVSWKDPRSPISEAYRSLRTSISFSNLDNPPRLIVITSSAPGDGKTTSSANLAVTLSQQGISTLLIDADLRRGVLHEVFRQRRDPGLTNLLLGVTPLEETTRRIDLGGSGNYLDFMPTGITPPNPSEMLGSDRMIELLKVLRGKYHTIIFDAPPLGPVTDAAVLGRHSDAVIIVARSGATTRHSLNHAVNQLNHLGVRIGGVVLNDISNMEARYYGSGEYTANEVGT